MERCVNRGEIWWAEIASKRRPVLVLTRSEAIAVRELVTVAEVTTSDRGLSVEVPLDPEMSGLPRESVVNCDGLYTVRRSTLRGRAGRLRGAAMERVCRAVSHALGCR